MKKFIILLSVAAICFCIGGCVDNPQQTEPVEERQCSGTFLPLEETGETTAATDNQNITQGTIQIPSPDDMPDAPTADYSLPGNEQPGDRNTNTQK